MYFGQTDTIGSKGKEYNIAEGLDGRSRSVRLNYLKPCIMYSWNVLARRGGAWSWLWASDQTFTTSGTCPVTEVGLNTGKVGTKVTTATGQNVTVVGTATGTATWSTIDGASIYHVYYGTVPGSYQHALVVPSSGTTVTINYLNPGQKYYYRVAAQVGSRLVWQDEMMLSLIR